MYQFNHAPHVPPVHPQVQLLGMEHNPDIMLLAARCLTFMADVLPTSCSSIVRHGAVQVGLGVECRERVCLHDSEWGHEAVRMRLS